MYCPYLERWVYVLCYVSCISFFLPIYRKFNLEALITTSAITSSIRNEAVQVHASVNFVAMRVIHLIVSLVFPKAHTL